MRKQDKTSGSQYMEDKTAAEDAADAAESAASEEEQQETEQKEQEAPEARFRTTDIKQTLADRTPGSSAGEDQDKEAAGAAASADEAGNIVD